MEYNELIAGIAKYGSSTDDICKQIFGIRGNQIHEKVIIAPWWEPNVFEGLGREVVQISEVCNIKIWNIKTDEFEISYIKTGIGAPVLIDVVLALKLTKCKSVVFVGSVGALVENISIGDIVIPEYSICGDGASRYLTSEPLKSNDVFGMKAFPDKALFNRTITVLNRICLESNVKYHIGQNFSTDSIFAQFVHINEILDMNCNVIEMETAAAFNAAAIAELPLVAVFSVSDNTIMKKSLISGRTDEDMNYRRNIRKYVFPKVILELFST